MMALLQNLVYPEKYVTRIHKQQVRMLFFIIIGVFFSIWSIGQTTRTWQPSTGGSWATSTNWIPNGVPAANDNVIIDKAQSAPITGIPNITLNGFTVSASCQLEPSNTNQTITVNGTFSVGAGAIVSFGITNSKMNMVLGPNAVGNIQGTFRQNASTPSGSFTVNGDLAMGSAGVISGAGSFSLASGATMRITSPGGIAASGATGHIQVTGSRSYNAGANYIYNGTVNQVTGDGLPTGLTGSLTIDNPATVTLTGTRTISSGTLKLMQGVFATGTQLSLGNTNTAVSVTLIRHFGTLSGTLQGANGYGVNYIGTSKNTGAEISGAGLRNITLNLAQGEILTLNRNISIPGVLMLTNGILSTESFSLNLTSNASNTLMGGSPVSYVIGQLQRGIATGASIYNFPVGSAKGYAPVSLNFISNNTAGSLSVSSQEGDNQNITQTSINSFRSVNRNWDFIIVSGLTNATYNATFEWVAADEDAGFDFNNAIVGRWSGQQWSFPTVGNRFSSSIQVNGVTGAGNFQVGKSCVITKVMKQPANARICSDGSVQLLVEAVGDGQLTYQWRKDGSDLLGETAASFVANTAGNYSVKVTGECRDDISNDAVVSIKKPTAIQVQPISDTKCAGDVLSVQAEGDGAVYYQWMKDGADIMGATAATYAVQEVGNYSVRVWADCGLVQSDEAKVNLHTPTEILQDPADVTITYGESTSFAIAAAGTGTLAYKWQVASADSWADAVTPGNEPVVQTENLNLNVPGGLLNGTRYRCVVTGFCGDAISRDAVLTVNKAPLFVISDDAVKTYGDANPQFTVKYAGFVNNELLETSDLSGAPAFETVADELSPVGEYAIVPVKGSLSSMNYAFDYSGSKLTINKATLTATAENKSRIYGDENPLFTFVYTGFKNREDAQSAAIEGSPVLSTEAIATTAVGEYDITAAAGTLSAPNYDFALVNGKLTINKATLQVTADNKTRVYGDPNPVLTVQYTGFKNSETLATSGVAGAPDIATPATPQSTVGTYEVVPSIGGLAAGNYDFTFAKGVLTVNQAPLIVKANNLTKFYGNVNPELTFSFNGFKNGEDAVTGGVSGGPALATTAIQLSDVGQYPISIKRNDLDAVNYAFTVQNGVLTIQQAPCISSGSLVVSDSCFGKPMQVTFIPSGNDAGPFTLVINDSIYSNIQAGVPFTTGKISESVPESIWTPDVIGGEPGVEDNAAVELGVKFRPNVAGKITGIRFYKRAGNTGTHTGSLWSSTGTLLATATFVDETETGWQQVNFSTPVTVTPGQIYVASYFAPNGNYAYTPDVFTGKRVSNVGGSLTALFANEGGNGLYRYSAQSAFPNGVSGANYYVDVVFENTNSIARYSLTGVISSSGCANNAFPISAPTAKMRKFIGLSFAKKDLDCVENNDGFITLNAVSCYTPLLYSIDNGVSYVKSNEFTNLGPGTYKVRIKDVTGYEIDTTISLTLEIAVWTGAVNSDWHNAGNWSTNKVPTSSTHVIVPVTANKISLNANATAASIQVAQGTQVRVLANRKLTMTGKCKQLPNQ